MNDDARWQALEAYVNLIEQQLAALAARVQVLENQQASLGLKLGGS